MTWNPGFPIPYPNDNEESVDHDTFALSATYSATLDTPYESSDHVMHKVLGGTFTPLSDTVEVEVDWVGMVEGVGHISGFFAWNQESEPGEDLLTGEGFENDSHVPGTSVETIGPGGGPGNVGGSSRRFSISGLQAGTPTHWEVELGATGYYESYEFGAGTFPIDLALSLDGETLYVTQYAANRVARFSPGNRWSTDGMIHSRGELRGHPGAYGIAIHPSDPDKIYVSRFDLNTVVEINPHTNVVLQSFAVTGPYYLAVSADGSKLWVVQQAANQITPITLSNGSIGTPIAVGSGPWKPVVVGANLYVACSGADRVDRINTGTSALTSLEMGSNTDPVAVSPEPDGLHLWVLEKASGVKRARRIDLSTFTFTDDDPVTGITSGSANDLGVSPSGKSMVVGGSSSGDDLQTFVLPSKGVIYEGASGTDIARLVLGSEGDIFAINNVDSGVLQHWHSARVEIDPASEFWGAHMSVTVTPAEEV